MVGQKNSNFFGSSTTITTTTTCEDDLYTPVKSRKHKNSKKNSNFIDSSSNSTINNGREVENLGNKKYSSIDDDDKTNLSRFLDSTIPSVPAQYISKTTMKGMSTCVEYQEYFTLNDLWESFKECSAYGAGIPLVLDDLNDGIVQYHVPYLSAIQLFGESSNFDAKSSGNSGKNSDGDNSDDSSDYEFEEDVNYTSPEEYFNKEDDVPSEGGSLSSPCEQQLSEESFRGDEVDGGNSQGQLLFQFFEKESPYCREPLASKVGELANMYPQLKTLRSCDLLPCSWMSVAWYPIYRIPSGSTLKDLDACFLTYHYLSSPLKGSEGRSYSPKSNYACEIDGAPRIMLPAFGLAFYKFKGLIWTESGDSECPLLNSLLLSADNWLKQLRVHHPDFEFFVSRSSC